MARRVEVALAPEASRALERGKRFLLARQGGDGLWRDFRTPAGEASEWPTGFVGTALNLAGAADAVERAADALVATQNEDGGWAYGEDVPTDADSTACVLLFLALVGGREQSCRRAASCLVSYQQAETGGVATYRESGPIRRFMGLGRWMPFGGWCSPQTEVTALAGRALAAATAKGSPATAAAWSHVRSRQRADGSWGSYWWTSPHYATCQAVALARSAGDRGAVERAAEWATREQHGSGGWTAPGAEPSAFATALCLSVLADAGASGRHVERAVGALAALQQDDGGWPSHPIMRIPLPGDRHPDRRRPRAPRLSGGMVVRDQHRTFTSAACVAALARVSA